MSEPLIEPAVEPGAEPAAEPWSLSQDEWSQFQQQQQELSSAVSYLANLEQQRASVYQPQPGGQPAPDAWEDPDAWFEAKLQDRLAPFQQTQQQVAVNQWQETIADIMEAEASERGDFDQDLADLYATRIYPEELQRAGGDQIRALEATVQKAAQLVRDRDRQRDEQAVARYTNQVSTLAGAPAEPGSAYSQGIEQRVVPDYRKGAGSVTERFFGSDAA